MKYEPISRGLITYMNLQSPKDRREKRQKKNFEERAKQLFDKQYKTTHPRNSKNPRHKKI